MLTTPLLLVLLVSVCGSDIIPPHPSSPRPGASQLPTRQGSIFFPNIPIFSGSLNLQKYFISILGSDSTTLSDCSLSTLCECSLIAL